MENPFDKIISLLVKFELKLNRIEEIQSERNDEWDWVGMDKASELLDLSKSDIYAKTSKGEIPFTKRRKKLYFSKKKLSDWIESIDNELLDIK